jgi:coenzyme F420 hydrogenase subunit beta
VDIGKIEKIDIPRNDDFIVYTNGTQARVPIEKIKSFVRPTCDLCFDVTAELADVSVGSTEWQDDWNTMLVRSEAAEKLVADASNAGVIACAEFPGDRSALLRQAVGNKKKRVIEKLGESASEKLPLGYLKIGDEQRKSLEEGGSQ